MEPEASNETLESERRRNREDAIRHARWEAEMARKLGRKWYETRDGWLIQAHEADKKMWRDPKIRDALAKVFLNRENELMD